jgi:hypothetical protein
MTKQSEGLVVFRGKISEADYDEFMKYCPQHGANQWFIETCVREFLVECRKNPGVVDNIRAAIQHANSMAYGRKPNAVQDGGATLRTDE